jgi:hypothetical protein
MNPDVDTAGVIAPIADRKAMLGRERREISILLAREEVRRSTARCSQTPSGTGSSHTKVLAPFRLQTWSSEGKSLDRGPFSVPSPECTIEWRRLYGAAQSQRRHPGSLSQFGRGVRRGNKALPAGGAQAVRDPINAEFPRSPHAQNYCHHGRVRAL